MIRKRTVSVRLDQEEARRLKKAASLAGQSQGAFLQKAGTEMARRTLLSWAVARYRQGEASFSQLAEETGLGVEEIMAAMGSQGQEAALEMFLASCETVAATRDNPDFLRMAREAVKEISSDQAA